MKPKQRKRTYIFCGLLRATKEGNHAHVVDIYATQAVNSEAAKSEIEKAIEEDCRKTFPIDEGYTGHYSALGTNLTGKVTLTDKGKEWTGIK